MRTWNTFSTVSSTQVLSPEAISSPSSLFSVFHWLYNCCSYLLPGPLPPAPLLLCPLPSTLLLDALSKYKSNPVLHLNKALLFSPAPTRQSPRSSAQWIMPFRASSALSLSSSFLPPFLPSPLQLFSQPLIVLQVPSACHTVGA